MAESGSAASISRQYLERSTYHRLKLKTVMSPPHLRLPVSPTNRFPPKALAFTSAAMSTISTSSTPSSPPLTDPERSSLSQVLTYHNQTKHSFTNYARGPRGLDWANQPNPFRRFVSSPLLPLLRFPTRDENPTQPSSSESLFDGPLYGSLFRSLPPPEPVSYSSISRFFYDSLALSAWKTAGNSTWSLRVNPSSGNLHPTEAYVVFPEVGNLYGSSSFVAHYAPKEHALEVRAEIPSGFLRKFFPEDCFLVGLSSIFWREAWKYGERAFRYCNHDVGHAIAAVSMAAAGLGWDVRILDGLGYEDLKKLMGLHVYKELPIPSRPVKGKIPDIEFEHPDCVLAVFPSGSSELRVDYGEVSAAIADFPKLEWKGRPNMLSKEHFCWDVIYRTAEAVEKPLVKTDEFSIDPFVSSGSLSEKSYKGFTVREVVRKRRSAVDMDGVTTMDRDTFYQILLHCLPSGYVIDGKQMKPTALPFRALSWDAQVHATLFVHRVTGLPKGLYFLVRNEGHFEKLRKSTRPDFDWVKPEGCPVNLPLYELATANCEKIAKQLSCHQDIAGDGCFSLGMIAYLEPTLHEKGPWMYPRLFWETGVLGQVLYLEAHAVGISATGIGCFFDDPVHELLGLKGLDFQSLYHFTVGGPVLDRRIMSLPAYPGPNMDV